MPTARPRHVLTETEDLADAIDAASALFPGESRADILRRLVKLGAATVAEQQEQHRQAVRSHAGGHPGLFPDGYLDDLRSDWDDDRR
ncbi:MAG: hypothetical protein ACKV2O_16355 [Acidimicrobiales bacterium]